MSGNQTLTSPDRATRGATGPLFDGEIPNLFGASNRLVVDFDHTIWNGWRVDFDNITHLAYRAQPCLFNMLHQGMKRDIHIFATSPETALLDEIALGPALEISLDDRGWGQRHDGLGAYIALVDALHRHVEPRLVRRTLDQILAGELIEIGPLGVSAIGLLIRRRVGRDRILRWSDIPSAELDGTDILIRATSGKWRGQVTSVSMLIPDAVLIPELIDALSN